MRLFDDEVGAVRAAHSDNLAKRRHVAADRVQPLDNDEPIAALRRQPFQLLAEAGRRVVPETDYLSGRLARRIVDARVAVAVDQDDVARAAEPAEQRQIALGAG